MSSIDKDINLILDKYMILDLENKEKLINYINNLKREIVSINKGIDELIIDYKNKLEERTKRITYYKEINNKDMYMLNKQAEHDYNYIIKQLENLKENK